MKFLTLHIKCPNRGDFVMKHVDLVKKIDRLIEARIQEPDMSYSFEIDSTVGILESFKQQEPGLYKHLFDKFFDELHPY